MSKYKQFLSAYGKDSVRVFEHTYELVEQAAFSRNQFHLFHYLIKVMKPDNTIHKTTSEIAKETNIRPRCLYPNLRKLIYGNFLKQGKQGNYMLNPHLAIRCQPKLIYELLHDYDEF